MKFVLRLFLVLAAALIFLSASGALAFTLANRTNGEIVSEGETRRYLLYVPESYEPSVPTPLVISIHGYASWPAQQAQVSGWNTLADENGFIVVYPAGSSFPMRWRASWDGTDIDTGFISNLIDHLSAQYHIDPQRIYANGLSNGGGMSVLLACRLSGRIAAIGSVSGAYLLPWERCSPDRPVPAILFHGSDDQVVPFRGGPSRMFDVPFLDVTNWVTELAARNGCTAETEPLPPVGAVSGVRYTGCDENAEVIFYTIEGGGHTWPGGDPLPEFITGKTSTDIDATRLMWDFFQRHPLED